MASEQTPEDDELALEAEETRHYLEDPNVPSDDRDDDEREAADELEVDQTELEELGLVLDDPHQPETD
jgi:hypothetical protein